MAVRAYVETSIPSFYFEARAEPQMVARREWTREWWSRAMTVQTDLVTSLAVIDELERGDFDARSDCLGLISGLPVLAIEAPIIEIVQAYIRHRTQRGTRCTLRLPRIIGASSSSWNCKHLANASKFGHIRRVNTLLGLLTPALVTPLELLGDTNDED